MRCPFLREAHVKYCQASPFRKMILESARDAGHERCSSEAYVHCPAAAPKVTGRSIGVRCPFLQDASVEYCGAATVTKFVPANDALLSRCNSDRHLYCELYLSTTDPRGERLPGTAGLLRSTGSGHLMVVVDGIPVPGHLSYAPNHMWLDVAEDGRCHLGVDGFLTKVMGRVEAISFVKPGKGADHPVAVLTVNGVDMHLVFPQALENVVANAQLRTNAAKLTADPYGAGWLFEGVEPTMHGAPVGAAARAGLIGGESAARWIFAEANRLLEFVQERIAQPVADGTRLTADSGQAEPGLGWRLGRDALINLFNEFFSPHLKWRRSW